MAKPYLHMAEEMCLHHAWVLQEEQDIDEEEASESARQKVWSKRMSASSQQLFPLIMQQGAAPSRGGPLIFLMCPINQQAPPVVQQLQLNPVGQPGGAA